MDAEQLRRWRETATVLELVEPSEKKSNFIKSQYKNNLLNLEVFSSNEAQISWNPIANPHFYYIANNEFFSMNAAFLSLPYHCTKL